MASEPEYELEYLGPTGGDKRFGLKGPRDLLDKLEWELQSLDRNSDAAFAYGCFNAAVTAWHLTDWCWNAMDEDQRSSLCGPGAKLKDFQALLRSDCRELAICDQLANGSKHFERTMHNDPGVKATVSRGVNVYENPQTGDFAFEEADVLFVHDGAQGYAPEGLYRRVIEYWTGFLATHDL